MLLLQAAGETESCFFLHLWESSLNHFLNEAFPLLYRFLHPEDHGINLPQITFISSSQTSHCPSSVGTWWPEILGRLWLIGKDPDAGEDWGREEKGTAEDETVGWHPSLDGHESEQVLGTGDGQGGLACCSPWGSKESDLTDWLKWTEPIPNVTWCVESCEKMACP